MKDRLADIYYDFLEWCYELREYIRIYGAWYTIRYFSTIRFMRLKSRFRKMSSDDIANYLKSRNIDTTELCANVRRAISDYRELVTKKLK